MINRTLILAFALLAIANTSCVKKTRSTATSTGDGLKVAAVVEIRRPPSDPSAPGPDFDTYKTNLEILLRSRAVITKVVQDPKVSAIKFVKAGTDPVKNVQDILTTEWKSPGHLKVTLTGEPADEMIMVLDVLLAKFAEAAKAEQQTEMASRMGLMQKTLDELKKQFDTQKQLLEELKKLENSTADVNAELAPVKAKIDSLQKLIGDHKRGDAANDPIVVREAPAIVK